MIFCPRFYFQSALRTWQDSEVFESLSGSRDQWNQWVLDEIPSRLRSRYKWGINANGTLPVGFVFLKRKKSFLKGRTIVSYSDSCIKDLLKAASQAILLMIRLVWPEAMGMATTPQLWKSLHEFLQRTPSAVHLAEVNDDLVGFFNSVPRQQILDSLSRLVGLYQERDFPPRITVSLRKLSNSECAWPGKPWARGQIFACVGSGIDSFCVDQSRRLHHVGADVPTTPRNLRWQPDQSCLKQPSCDSKRIMLATRVDTIFNQLSFLRHSACRVVHL